MIEKKDIFGLYYSLHKKNGIEYKDYLSLIRHVNAVESIALALTENISNNIAFRHYKPNRHEISTGALLHDIGRLYCKPMLKNGYEMIFHGILGGYFLRELKKLNNELLFKYAKICERHVGTGLSKEFLLSEANKLNNSKEFIEKTIEERQTFHPETFEEIIISFADKITKGTKIMTVSETYNNLKTKINEKTANKFLEHFTILKHRGAFIKNQ